MISARSWIKSYGSRTDTGRKIRSSSTILPTISVLSDDGKGVKSLRVTCEKDVENLKYPLKRYPPASGSRKSFVYPFKRKYLVMQDNGDNLAKAHASLSADQKKAFKDAVL